MYSYCCCSYLLVDETTVTAVMVMSVDGSIAGADLPDDLLEGVGGCVSTGSPGPLVAPCAADGSEDLSSTVSTRTCARIAGTGASKSTSFRRDVCFLDLAIFYTGGAFSYLPHHLDLALEDSVGHSTCMSVLARRRAIMGWLVG